MSTKLFVGGLPWGMDTQRLKEVFAEFGDLVDARVITDRETGRSRGFGFVTYGSPEGADRAITLDGQEVDGRRIRVDRAQEKERPSGPPGPPRPSRPDGQGGGPPRSFDGPPRSPSPSVAPAKPKASVGAAPGRDRGGGGGGRPEGGGGGGGDDFGRKPEKAGRGRRKGGRGGRGGGGEGGGGDFDDYEY